MVQNPTHIETVFVEESDDRLAKVEEAKRTGNAFQSSGSRGGEVVPYAIANQIAEENSRQDTDVYNGRPVAAHRKDYIDKVLNEEGFVARTNEEKANAHHAYSAELVRQREKKNKEDAERLANGEDLAEQRRIENQRLADDYAKASAAYAVKRMEHVNNAQPLYDKVAEIVQAVPVEELFSLSLEEQAKRLSDAVTIPTANEKPATDALKIKDAIIATEESFEAHAEGGVVTDFEQRNEQVEEAKRNDVVLPAKVKAKDRTPEAKPEEATAADVANPPTADVNKGNDDAQDSEVGEITNEGDISTPEAGFVEPITPEDNGKNKKLSEDEKGNREQQAQVVPSSKAERKSNKK